MNNQWNLRHLGTILRGTDPTEYNGPQEYHIYISGRFKSYSCVVSRVQTFDLDRNGYVSRTELRTATVSLGLSYTDAEIDAMMMQADTNGDGRIDYRGQSRRLRAQL